MKTENKQQQLLSRFMAEAPFQPATNLWRCVELPVLANALPSTGRGLDVGCGDGVLTAILRELAGANWELTGIDPDPAETALATQSGQYKSVHTCGADAIPEADGVFDFAFANSVLEHIPNLSACIVDVARCLKPGGLFAATVPSPYFHGCLRGPSATSARRAYLDEIDDRLAHRHYWSVEQWQKELATAGLEQLTISAYLSRRQVRRWEFWSYWTGGLLYRLNRKQQKPIAIQRSLGLRRGLPRRLRFLSGSIARTVGTGVFGDQRTELEANGCFLVLASKRIGKA